MEERRKKFPQLIEYLETQLGNEYNYWIIECVFRVDTEYEGTAIEDAMDVNVGAGTYVECGVEEKTTEEQDLECYRIDSIAFTVGGDDSASYGNERAGGIEKWIATGHFSVDVSSLSKFAKEYSGSIAALCANNQDNWEYEGEFTGKGNEISVRIKPVESDEILDITELRYSMMKYVECLLYVEKI